MTDKPKRPWFRFHLLTLVLMALAAGGAMALSVVQYRARPTVGSLRWLHAHASDTLPTRGWPLAFWQGWYGSNWDWRAFALDVVALMLAVFVLTVLSEYLLRRREGRKP